MSIAIEFSIASKEALSIFISSIFLLSKEATEYSKEFSIINLNSISRFFLVSNLESFRPCITWVSSITTADAYTGPARQPLPTSSTPTISAIRFIFISYATMSSIALADLRAEFFLSE